MKLRLSLTMSFTRDRVEPRRAPDGLMIFESPGSAIEQDYRAT